MLLHATNARLKLEAENRRLLATLDDRGRSQANSDERVQAQIEDPLRSELPSVIGVVGADEQQHELPTPLEPSCFGASMKIGMSQIGKFTGLAMLGLLLSTGLAAAQSAPRPSESVAAELLAESTPKPASTGGPAEKAATAAGAPTTQAAATQLFETSFDGNENPLSEGGVWLHTNNIYTKPAKVNGVAHGTQSGSTSQQRTNLYDDSYAILSGFSPNQKASGILQRSSGPIDGSCSHEVEILLRWADSSNGARGYECLINHDGGYAQIMRWNGTYGSFTELAGNSFTSLSSGDRVECQVVGNVITMSINGTKLAEATDGTYATGNPGVGFFRGNCGSNSDVGFTSFEAHGSDGAFDDTVKPMPPTDLTAN